MAQRSFVRILSIWIIAALSGLGCSDDTGSQVSPGSDSAASDLFFNDTSGPLTTDCASAVDCLEGQGCLANTGRCGDCRVASECRAGESCTDGVCGACVEAADCQGQLCVRGECVACTFGEDDALCAAQYSDDDVLCQSGGLCAPLTCLSGADCYTLTQVCGDNTCAPCESASDCLAAGTGDYPPGTSCLDGACIEPECTPETQDDRCASNLCENFLCADCFTLDDCGDDRICDINDRQCLEGECILSTHCGLFEDTIAGQVCVGSEMGGQCAPCGTNLDCLFGGYPTGTYCDNDGLCVQLSCDGVLVDPTSNPNHCGGCGLECFDGQICARPAEGEAPRCTCDEDSPMQVTLATPWRTENGQVPIPFDLSLTYSCEVDRATTTSATMMLHGQGPITIQDFSDPGDPFAVLAEPSRALLAGERLQITATAGVENTLGSPATSFVWQFSAAPDAGSGAFGAPRLDSGPGEDVALGDLDGDGDLDAFVTNGNYQPNTVWLSEGDGHFSDSGQQLGASTSHNVALGDLDGDGDLDAVVANSQGDDSQVWWNDGVGAFTPGETLSSAKGVALGDLDGDGDLDVFLAGQGPNVVWFNAGAGAFPNANQSLGSANSQSVALGDLDGDGDLDAVVANGSGDDNAVWLNDGVGGFTNNGESLGTDRSNDVALGDLDLDGDLDAWIVNRDASDQVWLNDGAGVFTADYQDTFGSSSEAFRVALTDLDDDGDLDAVVAVSHPLVMISGARNRIFFNTRRPIVFPPPSVAPPLFTEDTVQASQANSRGVALGDLDGDDVPDAFFINRSSTDAVGLGFLDGSTFNFERLGGHIGDALTNAIALGDLDADGDLDVFAANTSSVGGPRHLVWHNNGRGVFEAARNGFGNDTMAQDVALGDLDGDGDLDAFLTLGNVTLAAANRVMFNDGVNAGGLVQFLDSGQSLGVRGNSVALGDLDGDGDLDAFIANDRFLSDPGSGADTIWFNDGAGIFANSGQELAIMPSSDVALEDLDSDGDLDAFITNRSGGNRVWFNDGLGVFTDSGQSLGEYSSMAVALGDLDGDGDPDAFVANGQGEPNTVWWNNDKGLFSDSGQRLGMNSSQAVVLGDVDNDGDLDAFVVSAEVGEHDLVWFNSGGSFFSDSSFGPGGFNGDSAGTGIVMGDLDGDGDLDIFRSSTTTNSVLWNQ